MGVLTKRVNDGSRILFVFCLMFRCWTVICHWLLAGRPLPADELGRCMVRMEE